MSEPAAPAGPDREPNDSAHSLQPISAVSAWLRFLLWLCVLVMPGGILLVPLLVGERLRRSNQVVEEREPSCSHVHAPEA